MSVTPGPLVPAAASPWLSLLFFALWLLWGVWPSLWRGLVWIGYAVHFFVVGGFWEVWSRIKRR